MTWVQWGRSVYGKGRGSSQVRCGASPQQLRPVALEIRSQPFDERLLGRQPLAAKRRHV